MKLTLAVASVLAMVSLPVRAADNPPGPPLGAGGPAPATGAPSEHKVLAVVGGTEITSEQLDALLSKFADLESKPAEVREMLARHYLQSLIAIATIHKLVEKEKVQCTEAEFSSYRQQIYEPFAEKAKMTVDQYIKDRKISQNEMADRTNLFKMMVEASSKEKVAAFVKDNPD